MEIRLQNAKWSIDESQRLGEEGGFGEVFLGNGPDGEVAIKRLKLGAHAAAHRELKIGESISGRETGNIVPVLDYGQDAQTERYFLVMPLCNESLSAKLQREGPMRMQEACDTMVSVLKGLEEAGDIVHRDLKPANILNHDGKWKIADFGIAKFVEDSTSLETLRRALTPAYAAPEQWRGERPTGATDIYSSGCIFHSILTGSPPFHQADDLRLAHLSTPPERLDNCPPRVAALVSQMLRKSPEARPTLERCIDIFQKSGGDSEGMKPSSLAHAAQSVAEAAATRDAEAQLRAKRQADWAALQEEAKAEFAGIKDRLYGSILEASEEASTEGNVLVFGEGQTNFGPVQFLYGAEDGGFNIDYCKWDVPCYSFATLNTSKGYVWSSTLCFAKTKDDLTYRWRELGFWHMLRSSGSDNEPAAYAPNTRDFALALSNTVADVNVAIGPYTIDGEDEATFTQRWQTLVARAAVGRLQRPNVMPIPQAFYVE